MSRPRFETAEIATDRLVTLTDGVFAIAMTILVLELAIPGTERLVTDAELGELLLEGWADFLIYGLSFLVLGMFWMMHHAIFDAVTHYDFALQWLNITFLLFACLIPFSTALFGEHGTTRTTALVYGFNMLMIFGSLWALWAYATRGKRLVSSELDPQMLRGANLMGGLYALLILIPILLAFVSPIASFAFYGVVVFGFFISTALGRWDMVMVLPTVRRRARGSL